MNKNRFRWWPVFKAEVRCCLYLLVGAFRGEQEIRFIEYGRVTLVAAVRRNTVVRIFWNPDEMSVPEIERKLWSIRLKS